MTWETYLVEHQSQHQNELLQFLSIPSISSLPAHAADVQRAAQWVAGRLTAAGLEGVRILETGGHPVVYGEWLHAAEKPTILIYGHFDTQPVDPLALWTHPPFEPTIIEDRVYARGASDDKGNMFTPILGIEALLKTEGALPVNVKFFFEGQEEIGSPQLPAFIEQHRDLLACDLVVSSDGGQYSEDQPSLMLAAKGLTGVQIDVRGAKGDLHSGMYGGAVPNPIHVLTAILASMRSAEGKILVEGFYDAVVPLSEADRVAIAAIPFDEREYREQIGVSALLAEPGYTPQEHLGARPTLEINGIWGGFQGEGVKTVLPAEAHAKITCRLVVNQDPATIVDLIARHVEKHTPTGVQVTVRALPGTARPYLIPADHWGNQAAAAVLEELYGKEPYQVRVGGSIPVCELFLTHLGAYTVGFAFGLNDEQIHAPNEFFRLSSFRRGPLAYGKLLHRLAAK
ncbi:peptidase M20 [Reticulibacter mediterranei]|uniref:Peptidase M20 n=1 Tax=Reticulibacter mediterranei TaxID=2778369 RepID=A0A8J3IUH9_9CHLR|nr:dipeptidase [Reticulibacter mediterranei]GHP01112.1 peptidase M20 [Reticulibacter mediterranei]